MGVYNAMNKLQKEFGQTWSLEKRRLAQSWWERIARGISFQFSCDHDMERVRETTLAALTHVSTEIDSVMSDQLAKQLNQLSINK